jgi:hypothetical protein
MSYEKPVLITLSVAAGVIHGSNNDGGGSSHTKDGSTAKHASTEEGGDTGTGGDATTSTSASAYEADE